MLPRLISSLALTGILASAQTTQSESGPKPGRIEGRVANALTNEPVRKATVTLMGAPQGGGQQQGPGQGGFPTPFGGGAGSRLAVTTDAEGKFVFENLSPGNYRLSAEKAGFVRNAGGPGGPGGGPGGGGGFGGRGGGFGGLNIGSSIRVTEGSSAAGILLKLMPQGIVSGKVLDEDGEAFGQVRIALFEWNYAGGTARLQPAGMAETDELGNFRVANLAPGRYYLSAEKSGGLTTGRRREARQASRQAPILAGEETYAYARTYFPGVEELDQAERISVQAGQELSGLSLSLRKRRVYSVQGSVGNLPAEGRYFVQLSKSGGTATPVGFGPGMGGMGVGRVNEGRFVISNVLPGNYTVRLSEMSDRRPKLLARGEVAVSNDDVLNVSLAGVSPAALRGRIRIDGQNTVPQNLQSLRLELRPLEGAGFGPGGESITINPDGSFQLASLSPEIYGLSLAAERLNHYVKSISVNGQDVRTGLDLRSGGSMEVDIVLSPKVGSLNGRVQLAEGAEAGSILVIREPYQPRQFGAKVLRGSVQSDGSFTIANLEPGSYRVLAVEELDQRLMYDPEWLTTQAGESVTVDIGEGGSKAVNLRQIRK